MEPVWLMVMFDLPTRTKNQMRQANRYRNLLKDLGFERLQLSVYAKYYLSANATKLDINELELSVPNHGAVRILKVTDMQWSKTIVHLGSKVLDAEEADDILDVF